MISVVIPVYNGEKTIARAIDSVLLQDTELELLVVDNQSEDGTADVVGKYLTDPRVRYIVNPTDLGVAGNRNRGVQEAGGTYIAFLDADDWWEPGKLKEQLKVMEETGAVLSSTARRLHCPGSKKDGRIIHVPRKVTYHDLLGCNYIACSSVMIRREIAQEFPMEHAEVHEDYLNWLKILGKYRESAGIDTPYLNYTLSNTGKSGNKLHAAAMNLGVYHHAGLSLPASCVCFIRYAFHGLLNYYRPQK